MRFEQRFCKRKTRANTVSSPALSVSAFDLRDAAFAKKHGNKGGKHPTNYTSFLPKDKDVGPLRANRPDVLFRITKDGQHSAEPTGYLLDEGRIVLDAFDHGIRDFPHLPKVLSSELEGHDIEYYYRSNAQLTDYDLIGTWIAHH